jgi:hypothetical protein
LLQKLQQKIEELKKQALARATATEVAANEYHQRIKIQEQLTEAKAKIAFLQNQLDSSLKAKESAEQTRRVSSVQIDQIIKQELETVSQIEIILQTFTSTTRVETMEQNLVSLKQRIEEQRTHIAARKELSEAATEEKARNIIISNELENAKLAVGKLESEVTSLKEMIRVQTLEATEARIHAGITQNTKSNGAAFSKDGATLDELSTLIQKLVADGVRMEREKL